MVMSKTTVGKRGKGAFDVQAFFDAAGVHWTTRSVRIEEDLIDHPFNSSEKRLARTLLLLARYGKQDHPVRTVPHVSQASLAKIVGTPRSRITFFLNKFKRLGFIEYHGRLPLTTNSSLQRPACRPEFATSEILV
jgi:CRP/FNR family transcriptional regulator, cyclic AMP receptor protein